MGACFLEAAKLNNVNSVYLVAHALHESRYGKSDLAIEHNSFFGLGAKFAREHGWNTPDQGIMGSAEIISKTWINHASGTQRTLYSMRWNPANPGTRQYATDIAWADRQVKNIHKGIHEFMKMNPSYQPHYIIPQYREY